MANVVGPQEVLHLAGAPIERILTWAPHPGRQLGMTVSIFSHRSMASLTVIGDTHRVPDPEAITREFDREFKRLLERGTAKATKRTTTKAPAR